MKRVLISAATVLVIAMPLTVTAAPRKAAPAKAPAKVAPKPGKKPAGGKEEHELAGTNPVKLPERKYENLDMNKNPTRGTFTIAVSAGLYNFTNKIENPSTNTSRTYSLAGWDYTTVFGLDLSFRLGKDAEKDHDTKTGFHYYRSNRGIFTDFELGFKTQRTENKPSRFNYTQTSPSGTTEVPVDLGYDASLGGGVLGAQNLQKAGISDALRQGAGKTAAEVTMVYANAYYHFTPLNFIMNWGSGFRWFDASLGPSLRVWYYKDYSDPVRVTTRNDDWTYSTFMLVYRQYIQFHPQVRLRTHFYFPALTYFTQLAKSPRFNEMEYIVNTAIEVVPLRINNVGIIISVGYEGHWWFANQYSSDRYVRTGFAGDGGLTDANYSGFEHKTRTSWEAFASIGVDYHFGADDAPGTLRTDTAAPSTVNTTVPPQGTKPAPARPAPAKRR
ncbi:MAG: hypothetical protein KF713_06995 [Turneriella sp.]|nr:hypothetical protein [Turneriella sp.]